MTQVPGNPEKVVLCYPWLCAHHGMFGIVNFLFILEEINFKKLHFIDVDPFFKNEKRGQES